MPRTNKPVTLRDLAGDGSLNDDDDSHENTRTSNGNGGVNAARGGMSMPSSSTSSSSVHGGTTSSSSSSSNNKGNGIGGGLLHKVCHIPTLSSAQQAKALLERVVREFAPIAQERGYNVLSVSELCCCNDGLDFDQRPSAGRQQQRKKWAKMNDNVLGYNQTSMTRGGVRKKTHTIHLRLRHAQNHNVLFDYEDVAGTMAHELAHCERGPHDEIFFKLMDQIFEEHAIRMASNITITNGGGGQAVSMPSFSGTGQTLGGNNNNMGRSRLLQPGAFAGGGNGGGGGRKLGGDAAFTQWMTPTEAAAVAALARRRQEKLRLRGDGCCNSRGIFEISDTSGGNNDDDGDDDEQRKPRATTQRPGEGRKRAPAAAAAASTTGMTSRCSDENQSPNKRNKKRQQQTVTAKTTTCSKNGIIDLTFSDDDDDDDDDKNRKKFPQQQQRHSYYEWPCVQCTFLNPHSISVCNMCAAPKA